MGAVVGQIQINLGANTALFSMEMDRAAALAAKSTGQIQGTLQKLSAGAFKPTVDAAKGLGKSLDDMGHGGVTSVQAVSASLRTLEGGLNNNLRAAERFAASLPGIGSLAQKLFPVAGGLAFIGILGETAKKAYDLYQQFEMMQAAPEKIRGQFGELIGSLRSSNDELQIGNDKLQAEINKLTGKPTNGLKLAIDETIASADKLAESLSRTNRQVYALLKENQIDSLSIFSTFMGNATTKDLTEQFGGKTGFGGFSGQLSDAMEQGRQKIAAATTEQERNAAETAKNAAVQAVLARQMAYVNDQMDRSNKIEATHRAAQSLNSANLNPQEYERRLQLSSQDRGYRDQSDRLEMLKAERELIEQQQDADKKQTQHGALEAQRTSLGSRQKDDDPVKNAIIEQTGRLAEVKARLDSIGQSAAMRAIAEGAAQANKKIAELNEQLQLKPKKESVSPDQAKSLTDLYVGEAQTEQRARERESILNIRQQIDETQRLINVQLSGISATRAAELAKLEAMKPKPGDTPEARAAEAQNIQSRVGTGGISQNQAYAEQALLQQTQKLADAKKLADSDESDQKEVKSIQQRISETQRLIQAQLGGYAAIKAAQLANIDSEVAAGIITQSVGNAKKVELDLNERLALIQKTVKSTYEEQLELLIRQRDVLADMPGHEADVKRTVMEIQKVMDQQALATGKFADGIRVAFDDMAAHAQSGAQQSYQFVNQAFEGINGEITKMIEGQRVRWDEFFRSLAGSAAKMGLEKFEGGVLGKVIGGALGGNKSGVDPLKPTGSIGNPLYVKLLGSDGSIMKLPSWSGGSSGAGSGAGNSQSTISGWPTSGDDSDDDDSDDDSSGGGLSSIFAKIGGIGAGILPKLLHFAGFFADGGSIGGGSMAIVGENGPELFTPRTSGSIIPNSQLGKLGGGASYYIDARGADEAAVDKRVRSALVAVHGSAVRTSAAAQADIARRKP